MSRSGRLSPVTSAASRVTGVKSPRSRQLMLPREPSARRYDQNTRRLFWSRVSKSSRPSRSRSAVAKSVMVAPICAATDRSCAWVGSHWNRFTTSG